MLKNLSCRVLTLGLCLISASSCASSDLKWKGDMSEHMSRYMKSFDKFRKETCKPNVEEVFDTHLLAYRGQGYWIPELEDDVDVETIKSLLPQLEKKLQWIQSEKKRVQIKGIPKHQVTTKIEKQLKKLLNLKKDELSTDDKKKTIARSSSLKELEVLKKNTMLLLKKFHS